MLHTMVRTKTGSAELPGTFGQGNNVMGFDGSLACLEGHQFKSHVCTPLCYMQIDILYAK